jgi:hypothetical protein
LEKSLEKNNMIFRFVHALLLQYLSHASLVDTAEMLQTLQQFIPVLHHSVDGCRIICHMLSVGNSAKDRKGILKYFKGIVGNMAERPEGVWVINCALDVVDDTVLLDKVVLAELLPTIHEQLTHPNSAKIYLHVLNSHDAGIFSKEEQANYSQSTHWILNKNEATVKGEQGISKKDPTQKRLELLGVFLQPILHTLSTLPDTLAALLRSNTGHHLLIEVMREAWRLQHDQEAQNAATNAAAAPNGGDAAAAAGGKNKKGKKGAPASAATASGDAAEEGEDGAAAPAAVVPAGGSRFPAALAKNLRDIQTNLGYIFDAFVAECARPLGAEPEAAAASAAGAKGAKANALEDRFGHYVIKRLLAHLTPAPKEFASKLLEDALTPQLAQMATTNRPAFVLASYIETDALSNESSKLKKLLQPLLKQIIAAAGTTPVAPITKQEDGDESMGVDGNNKPSGHKKHVYAAHSTTNAGVSLLSKLLQGHPTDKHPAAAAAVAPATGGKKTAANKPAVVVPTTPASKSAPAAAAAAPKSSKKGSVKAEVITPAAVEEDEEEAPAAAAAAPASSPVRGHRRQWTHTSLDGTKEARLHRSPFKDVEEGEEEAAAPVSTPAKGKAATKKTNTTAKKSAAKKKQSSDDMEE